MKRVVPVSDMHEDYLSLDSGRQLRGACAITVILHHLAQRCDDGLVIHAFDNAGVLAVAVFFFLSGYGLQKSHIQKADYSKHFLLRRLPGILLPYAIVTCLFWGMYALNGTFYDLLDIVMSMLHGKPIVLFSWYILSILLFYIVYALLMKIFRKRYWGLILGACLWHVLYILICMKMHFNVCWYNASSLFILGMLWATYEPKMNAVCSRYYLWLAPVVWISFLLLFIFNDAIASWTSIKGTLLLLSVVYALLFVPAILLFTMKFKIGNRVLSYLGKISLELYLVQGLLIVGLRSRMLHIPSDTLWACMTVAGSVLLAAGLNALTGLFLKKYRQWLRAWL